MGRLTSDPELRATQNGISVTSFSIACEKNYKDKGENKYPVDFFEIVAWRKTADFICNYFTKGQLIAIDGTLQTRNYTDKENINRKVTEILAESVYFCGKKNGTQAENTDNVSDTDYNGDDNEFNNIPDFNPFS